MEVNNDYLEKANEAYFGDTFNRDIALCSCSAEIAYDTALDSDCTSIKAINWNDSGVATLACNEAAISKGTLDSLCNYGNAYAINTNVESESEIVSNRFYELQAQIDELKKRLETKKENLELRSALKTLHYKREVE